MKKPKMTFFYAISVNGRELLGSDYAGYIRHYTSYRALRRYGLTDQVIRQKLHNAASSGMPILSIYAVGNFCQDSSYHLLESFSPERF